MAKRVWARLEREAWEVVADATLEAEHRDPEHVKPWVVLVDGAEMQLANARAAAAARGVDVTVIVDIIHVVEYVWKAAHAFHRAGSPELACWAWTRVQRVLEGKARTVASSMRRAATVAGLSPEARKPVDTCVGYLRKYAQYLQYDRYLAAGYPIATGGRRGLPVPGARPDRADRRPLASGRRRGGPEAAGAASERRLRRVLGLPRGARVRAEPRPAIRRRDATAVQRAPRTPVPETPPAGGVALLVMRFPATATPCGRRRKRATPIAHSVPRGSLFHVRYHGDNAVAFVDDGHMQCRVFCREQGGALDQPIRYGLAVTIEAGEGVPVYQEIPQRLGIQPLVVANAP